ncbi:hypothetical protein Phum_PHUM550320 [Pediculus humanus corporis]|uniref:Uncharacterized protein n=1 Tax=Pediculus humanus subsp. corporis TaxID=121224 RepID=E0W0D6_PEDHC|nr:uncharacterized protein Phum_PHUM550320 [Pediculus humanus corporis]EEB19092.1 hypothetical protein Phum_PHUM550320 [Pediculus humanus corporis]
MFGGNAKTHFQVLGRDIKSKGYMMSPFGDERWDLDDNEKLKKIYKDPSKIQNYTKNNNCLNASQVSVNLQSNQNYQLNENPYQQHNPYQTMKPCIYGYAPAEPVSGAQHHQQIYYGDVVNNVHQYQRPKDQQGTKQYAECQPTPVKRFNGLNNEETKQKSKLPPGQVNNNNNNHRPWKSLTDVPVWIPASSLYRPFGPAEPTPNPFYPPREKNTYTPQI